MTDELIADVARSLLTVVESAVATNDMLSLLCIYFSRASPTEAADLAKALKQMRETDLVNKTDSFCVLAERLEQALTGDHELRFLSLTESSPTPANPSEMAARLRLILGGRS